MKPFLIFLFIGCQLFAGAQENESELSAIDEQQLENQAGREEAATEDDTYIQQLAYYRKHPLNLNSAGEPELHSLSMLSTIQVSSLLQYRALFGKLLSVYELQAVPGWDLATIYRLLPFITVNDSEVFIESIRKRIKGGEKKLLVSVSETIERSKGFRATTTNPFLGSRPTIFFRYRYNYKNLLQYGITGDKDAGEPFFGHALSTGFDFYSFHFFARKLGKVQALAAGDYSVNMGQGLIQWHSLAFKKNAAVLAVKRQSPALQPYTAAGEYNFYRGAGITLQQGNWIFTAFGSVRKLSAAISSDSLQPGNSVITTIQTSGYHRTFSEIENRNTVQHFAAGGILQYRRTNWHAGINFIRHTFSIPFARPEEPYDVFAVSGRHWGNYSMDYSYTLRNFHFFGEAAIDKNGSGALLQGLLISADTKTDVAFVYRTISSAYRALAGNAFTENSMPANEKGLYAGISVRPADSWKIDAYADFFRFPWLKYRVDIPSYGHEYMVQITYKPSRQVEIFCRYRSEEKTTNISNTNMTVHTPSQAKRVNWRSQVHFSPGRSFLLRSRVEWVQFAGAMGTEREYGFMWFCDAGFKPPGANASFGFRVQYFETDGYNSRIYTYENSGLYSFSIPAFFNKGVRFLARCSYKLHSKITGKNDCRLGLFIGQTIYNGTQIIGSGPDEIAGNRKSEVKFQLLVTIDSHK